MFYFLLPLLMSADELAPILPAKIERKEPIDYTKDVAPIFQAKCIACHSGKELKGQYDMGSHVGVLAGGKRKAAVVPGRPQESNLYLFSSHQMKPAMPPKTDDNDLTPQEVAVVKLWIEQGAKGPAAAEVRARAIVALTLPPDLVRPVRALAVQPATNVLAIGRGNRLLLVDLKSGETVATLIDPAIKRPDGQVANAAHLSLVESLAFSPDGATLATGSFREVVLWNVANRSIVARIGGFADKVSAIAWSPKGDRFATAGGAPTEDGEIRLFDATGRPVLDFKSPHSDSVFGVAFSPDGSKLASGSADKFVRVFDVGSGKLLKSFEGHTQHVLDVGWSPDGTRIVSAGADDLIKIWDFEKGERVRDLKGHAKQVSRLAFVGKAVNFFSVGGDGQTRRWSVESGDGARSFDGGKDSLYAVAASADGGIVASGGEEGVVRTFDSKTGQILKTIRFDGVK